MKKLRHKTKKDKVHCFSKGRSASEAHVVQENKNSRGIDIESRFTTRGIGNDHRPFPLPTAWFRSERAPS